MIYTEQTKKAMRLCFRAHEGQLDRSGIPYVYHPLHLAEQMPDEDSTVAALLHDVVEDTDYSLEDLREMDFPPRALEAVALLTHDPAEPYLDYVARVEKYAAAMRLLEEPPAQGAEADAANQRSGPEPERGENP